MRGWCRLPEVARSLGDHGTKVAIDRVVEGTERISVEDFNRDWMIQDAIIHHAGLR